MAREAPLMGLSRSPSSASCPGPLQEALGQFHGISSLLVFVEHIWLRYRILFEE